MKVGLILRTVKHLRWEQVIYRPIRLLQSHLDRTILSRYWTSSRITRDAPTEAAVATVARAFASLPHLTQPLSLYESRIGDLTEGRFSFLNRTLTLDPLDWNRRYESHLWNYNLHYFGYAVWCARAYIEGEDESALKSIRRLILHWVSEARPGVSDGWDPYPVSLRIVNWAYAYALVAPRLGTASFLSEWSSSIYRQLEFLSRHVEYHLLANHLIKNAKALIVGGLLFGEAKWIASGRALLLRELDEQVLSDGGHFERAPMYHAQVLADSLEAFAMLQAFGESDGSEKLRAKLAAMAGFLSAMSNRDGTLALFNDSANLEELSPEPILTSAVQVFGPPGDSRTFPATGYYTWASGDSKERIVVDAGPPAADYNMAHAHCDLLSYELWLNGHPFVVDSGVHGYGGDRFREYARSTRAHNTLVLDGLEQSEVWSTFRMGARARVVSAEARGDGEEWRFRGAYIPYFDHGLTHERRIERSAEGGWVFADAVKGGRAQRVESFIHLHPDVRARRLNDSRIECEFPGGRMLIEPFGIETVEVVQGAESPIQGWYFPEFGVARPNSTICMATMVKSGEEFGYTMRLQ